MKGLGDSIAYEMFMMDCGDEFTGDSPTIKDQIVMEAYAMMKISQMTKQAA